MRARAARPNFPTESTVSTLRREKATIVADDFLRPNGLCFSPAEDLLYIVDTGRSHDPDGPSHIRVFDVTGDNQLKKRPPVSST